MNDTRYSSFFSPYFTDFDSSSPFPPVAQKKSKLIKLDRQHRWPVEDSKLRSSWSIDTCGWTSHMNPESRECFSGVAMGTF